MWLTNSSIGRKVIMSVSGLALILFLTFHGCMNLVALFSEEGYNMVCKMLGANWYAVAATAALGALVVVHFVYAIILTLQNKKARGANKYAVTNKPEKVEWYSQNMFVLGVIVILGMGLHLYNFWYNMMLQELLPAGNHELAANGVYWIKETFSCPVYSVLYLVWLAALWFHLNHGFWSAFQTLGWNGKIWFCRLKAISLVYTTIVILMFVAVVVKFALCGGACCTACC